MPEPRSMPSSIEAEQSVLGAMLISEECVLDAIATLKEDDFYAPNHRSIYRAMYDLASVNRQIDIVTVVERLETDKKLSLEELRYITDLTQFVPYTRNIGDYITIVREKSLMRKLISACSQISDMAYTGSMTASEAIGAAGELIYSIAESRSGGDLEHIRQALLESYNTMSKAAANKGQLLGLTTGFSIMDRALAGLQPSQLIIIAARTGIGKTSFALNVAEHVATHEKRVVAIFSLEMSAEQLATRMLCGKAGVDSQKARLGQLRDPDDFNYLYDAMSALSSSGIYVDDNANITVTEMQAKLRQLKRKTGDLGLVVIDYLQLMNSDARTENRQQEIARITRGLKLMARELQVPVLLLSQLSREATKGDTKPKLSHLRESGAIEQDADVVLFLSRKDPDAGDGGGTDKETSILTIAKQRSGPTMEIGMKWIGNQTKYMETDILRDEDI